MLNSHTTYALKKQVFFALLSSNLFVYFRVFKKCNLKLKLFLNKIINNYHIYIYIYKETHKYVTFIFY